MTSAPRPTGRPTVNPTGVPRPSRGASHDRPTAPTGRPTPRPTGRPTASTLRLPPAGWIYLLHTYTDPAKYIGQTKQPVPKRVNRQRLPLDKGGQTWGHEILPGRQGYTILQRVESTGDPTLDAIALDLAEAEMIAQWHPSENTNRPNPQVFRDRLAEASRGAPTPSRGASRGTSHKPRPTAPRRPATPPVGRSHRLPWDSVGRLLLATVWGVGALRVGLATGGEWVPWAAVPIAVGLGPTATRWWWRHMVRGIKLPWRKRRRRRRR